MLINYLPEIFFCNVPYSMV
uniref:Uncharacterized protein n=1 Tax=Arundo donax TaxID=35708 RepID=A0A0A9A0M7_ARUDO